MISVLFVDPSPSILRKAQVYLAEAGEMDVTTARSTSEAEALIADRRFDAVVCDCRMPEMEGFALLRKVRASGDRIPFIIFSAAKKEDAAIKALEAGADYFVHKEESLRANFADLVRMIRDTVALRRMERSLSETLRQFRIVSESVPSVILTVDSDGCINDCNGRMAAKLGTAASSIRGRKITEFIERTGGDAGSIVETCLTSKTTDLECRLVRPDGERLDVLLNSTPLANPAGNPVGCILVLSDISETKRTLDTIRDLENRYRLLEEHVSDAVTGRDPEQRYSDFRKVS